MSVAAEKQANLTVVRHFDSQLCADSVEWCPLVPYQRIFVLGTYEVVKDEDSLEHGDLSSEDTSSSRATKRHGRLFMFEVSNSESLEPLQTVELPAILDMKWSHIRVGDKILLAVATAIGQLLIFELSDKLLLDQIASAELLNETTGEVLALSLDWSTGRFHHSTTEIYITVSDSLGCVTLYLLNNFNLKKVNRLKAHDYEAWIVAFDYWNPSTVFSGGDDCKLCVWDVRTESSVPQKKITSFDAGVTSLHCNALKENILACGSYDETFRIWDTRRMKMPLATTNLGGGIWRVKWDPHEWRHVIAASMYNGVHVLDCEATLCSGGEIVQIAHGTEHKSIAYGADWCYLSEDDVSSVFSCSTYMGDQCKVALVATCSFYDKQLHVSLVNKYKI